MTNLTGTVEGVCGLYCMYHVSPFAPLFGGDTVGFMLSPNSFPRLVPRFRASLIKLQFRSRAKYSTLPRALCAYCRPKEDTSVRRCLEDVEYRYIIRYQAT